VLGRSLILLAAMAGCTGPTGNVTVVVEPFAEAERRSQIEGVVTDLNTGAAIENARIVLTCPCLPPHIAAIEIDTKADGSYKLRNLIPGRYTVQMWFRQVTMERRVSVAAGTRGRVDFRVVPGEPFRVG
jgi:hypothetical protein